MPSEDAERGGSKSDSLDDQLVAVVAAVRQTLRGSAEGIYLYGSAVSGGLKPASDIDVLVVARRRLRESERRQLVDRLTPLSSQRKRPAAWRPVELTVVSLADVRPWRYPARMELQAGEWMRADIDAGILPKPRVNPDLAVLLEQVRRNGRAVLGPESSEFIDEVPHRELVAAMIDSLPTLLGDLEEDTANVLLTLARMWRTTTTNEFGPKDVAALWASARLPVALAVPLAKARDVYLGLAIDDWPDRRAADQVSKALAGEIGAAARIGFQ